MQIFYVVYFCKNLILGIIAKVMFVALLLMVVYCVLCICVRVRVCVHACVRACRVPQGPCGTFTM